MKRAPTTRPLFPGYKPHYCQEMRNRWQPLSMNAARHKDWIEKRTLWFRCPGCGKNWEVYSG